MRITADIGFVGAPADGFRSDAVYLGWVASVEPDPGPPPEPPPVGDPNLVRAAWLSAQWREHASQARRAFLTGAAGIAVAAALLGSWLAGVLPGGSALLSGALAVAVAGRVCAWLWRGRRALARQLLAEEQRVAGLQAAYRNELAAERQEYGRQLRGWQQRAAAFARRPQWQPVTIPLDVPRVEVAGGTLAGWSALLTTVAVARLAAGGELTVIDLTEGDVAADLLAVARHQGAEPLVWRLPADLPKLELGTDVGPDLLADVLARTVAAAGNQAAGHDHVARDAALLRRVLATLGGNATVEQLVAALRAVGQIGGPADHLRSARLTPEQLARLGTLAGRGAQQLVIERAWTMEAQLQVLSPLATGLVSQPASVLRVALLDGRAVPAGNDVVAAYLVIALAAALRQARPAMPWHQAVVLLGAERLPADVLDRFCHAAETSGTGLVLCYRTIPAHVRDRLGRGDGAVAFMRLGNAADARLAAEQIGTEHRFVISQLTETVGSSATDTVGGSHTSTVGRSESMAESRSLTRTTGRSRSHGRSRTGGLAPFSATGGSASRDTSLSVAQSDSRSVTAGINTGTSWGLSTSRAFGTTDSIATAAQRAREFLVEAQELQQLPPSAIVLCCPGREVTLADVNPAIMTLPTATLAARRNGPVH